MALWVFVVLMVSLSEAVRLHHLEDAARKLFDRTQEYHAETRMFHKLEQVQVHDIQSELDVFHSRRRLMSRSNEFRMNLGEMFTLGYDLEVVLTPNTGLFASNIKNDVLNSETGERMPHDDDPYTDCFYHVALSENPSSIIGSVALCDESHFFATLFLDDDKTSNKALSVEPLFPGKENRDLGSVLGTKHVIYYHQDVSFAIEIFDEEVHPAEMNPTSDKSLRQKAAPKAVNAQDVIQKYMGVTIFNDYTSYVTYGALTSTRASQVISVSNLYYTVWPSSAPYQMNLQIVRIVTFSTGVPFQESFSYGRVVDGQLLGQFSDWMISQRASFPSDAAIFLSGTSFQYASGWAYIGTACDPSMKYNVGVIDASFADPVVSLIAAHEMGHILGMQHDQIFNPYLNRDCSENLGVMAAVLTTLSVRFSNCSVSWMNNFLDNTYDYLVPACMEAPETVDGSTLVTRCGNGVVDQGEQCDPWNGVDPCCNIQTCQLLQGATCAAHQLCCDTNTCKPKTANQACTTYAQGKFSDSCYIDQTCDGTSPECAPVALRKSRLGTSCTFTQYGNTITNGYCTCYGCTSRDDICRVVSSILIGVGNCGATDPCSPLYCSDGNSCYLVSQAVPTGIKCGGTGYGCSSNNVCTSWSALTCPASKLVYDDSASVTTNAPAPPTTKAPAQAITKAPLTPKPTTRPPTAKTRKPTKFPTKKPTRKKRKNRRGL